MLKITFSTLCYLFLLVLKHVVLSTIRSSLPSNTPQVASCPATGQLCMMLHHQQNGEGVGTRRVTLIKWLTLKVIS